MIIHNYSKKVILLVIITTLFSCGDSESGDTIPATQTNNTEASNPQNQPNVNGEEIDSANNISQQFDLDTSRKIKTIQAESIPTITNWKKRTEIEGYKGSGYLIWEGADLFWKPNILTSSSLNYKIQIDEPGLFEFKWRSVVGKGTNATEHNDSWLKFPDADDFYTYINRDYVLNSKREKVEIANAPGKFYPNGSNKTPTGIGGENKEGFMKIFMNSTSWQEIASTWDHNGFRIFVEFKTAGEYTIQIAPRSSFHAIDELKLIPIKN